MLDPVTTPLLPLVLGKLGEELLTEACKDFLKGRLHSLFGWLGTVGRRNDLELAYQAALQDAYTVCLEMLLTNITACGYSKEELKPFADSLKMFAARNDVVADELLEALRNPLDPQRPAPGTLAQRWSELGCVEASRRSVDRRGLGVSPAGDETGVHQRADAGSAQRPEPNAGWRPQPKGSDVQNSILADGKPGHVDRVLLGQN